MRLQTGKIVLKYIENFVRREREAVNRFRDFLSDVVRQSDMVLLSLCTVSTLYGMVLTHSRTLLPMVDAMLKNADLTLDDINAIATRRGRLVHGPSHRHCGGQGPCLGRRQAVPRRSTLEAMAQNAAHIDGAYRRRDGRAPLAGL